MGIADGMSRLPKAMMGRSSIEDAIGTDAKCDWGQPGGGEENKAVRGTMAIRAVMVKAWVETLATGTVAMARTEETVRTEEEGAGWADGRMEMGRQKWGRFLLSNMYRRIVLFKLEGVRGLPDPAEDVGRNEMRAIAGKAGSFVLGEEADYEEAGRLFYRERDGRLAMCIVEEEIEKVLTEAHDVHGHFTHGITAGRLHSNNYWPSQNADIARWTASCKSCQRVAPIKKSGDIRPIIQLRPMDMWGMDNIGPINLPCAATGARYILIIVDYFSRFLFGRAVVEATMQSTMDAILNHVVPICGWPRSIYSDNGSHFTGGEMQTMLSNFGVTHFTPAISHPSSVGLA